MRVQAGYQYPKNRRDRIKLGLFGTYASLIDLYQSQDSLRGLTDLIIEDPQ